MTEERHDPRHSGSNGDSSNGDSNEGEHLGLDGAALAELRAEVQRWRGSTLARSLAKVPERAAEFTTWSGHVVPDVCTPLDARTCHSRDLGMPGEYPFTRGVQPTMYRSRQWTMRMFAGFGTADDTNWRFKEIIRSGGDGLSTKEWLLKMESE